MTATNWFHVLFSFLKKYGDYVGVAAKKRRTAMYKSSWRSKAIREMDQPPQ